MDPNPFGRLIGAQSLPKVTNDETKTYPSFLKPTKVRTRCHVLQHQQWMRPHIVRLSSLLRILCMHVSACAICQTRAERTLQLNRWSGGYWKEASFSRLGGLICLGCRVEFVSTAYARRFKREHGLWVTTIRTLWTWILYKYSCRVLVAGIAQGCGGGQLQGS